MINSQNKVKLAFVILFFTFLSLEKAESLSLDDIKIYGNTNYAKQENEKLTTTLNLEYKFLIHEHKSKKYALYISGNLSPDYDHFGKEIKINSFTGFSLDF